MAQSSPSRAATTNFGQRVREARLDCNLSQAELARALKAITKTKIHKALISQWETGRVNNPQIATIEALVAVTGYSSKWLATGKGPKKARLPDVLAADQASHPLDRMAFARAVESVVDASVKPGRKAASVALDLYDTLVESPATDDAVLKRFIDVALR